MSTSIAHRPTSAARARRAPTLPLAALLSLGLGCQGALTEVDGVSGASTRGSDAQTPTPEPAALVFRPDIQQDLEAAGCTSCHQSGSIPMHVTGSPESEADWQRNYDETRAHATHLFAVGAGEGGHPAIAEAGSAYEQRWATWSGAGTPYQRSGAADDPTEPPAGSDAGTGGGGGGGGSSGTPTWENGIGALFVSVGCTNCHGTAGSYGLDSYEAAMGNGSDGVPNVVPGSSSSVLYDFCERGHGEMGNDDARKVLKWIVEGYARQR